MTSPIALPAVHADHALEATFSAQRQAFAGNPCRRQHNGGSG